MVVIQVIHLNGRIADGRHSGESPEWPREVIRHHSCDSPEWRWRTHSGETLEWWQRAKVIQVNQLIGGGGHLGHSGDTGVAKIFNL